ncbi:hypothetical protein E2C01_084394 [Portunus trituberculatus]|uniref:Uncharacterized protein n=1 Tax=Portunus trituberculatus TaxID=210409 RepID=A0A5B7J667_PORTR|nr:hypothetical protein [Portunus trituberculatus]
MGQCHYEKLIILRECTPSQSLRTRQSNNWKKGKAKGEREQRVTGKGRERVSDTRWIRNILQLEVDGAVLRG